MPRSFDPSSDWTIDGAIQALREALAQPTPEARESAIQAFFLHPQAMDFIESAESAALTGWACEAASELPDDLLKRRYCRRLVTDASLDSVEASGDPAAIGQMALAVDYLAHHVQAGAWKRLLTGRAIDTVAASSRAEDIAVVASAVLVQPRELRADLMRRLLTRQAIATVAGDADPRPIALLSRAAGVLNGFHETGVMNWLLTPRAVDTVANSRVAPYIGQLAASALRLQPDDRIDATLTQLLKPETLQVLANHPSPGSLIRVARAVAQSGLRPRLAELLTAQSLALVGNVGSAPEIGEMAVLVDFLPAAQQEGAMSALLTRPVVWGVSQTIDTEAAVRVASGISKLPPDARDEALSLILTPDMCRLVATFGDVGRSSRAVEMAQGLPDIPHRVEATRALMTPAVLDAASRCQVPLVISRFAWAASRTLRPLEQAHNALDRLLQPSTLKTLISSADPDCLRTLDLVLSDNCSQRVCDRARDVLQAFPRGDERRGALPMFSHQLARDYRQVMLQNPPAGVDLPAPGRSAGPGL